MVERLEGSFPDFKEPQPWKESITGKKLEGLMTDDLDFDQVDPSYPKNLALPVLKPCIHSTNMDHLDECPRLFLYADRLGLRGRVSAVPLELGQLYHLIIAQLSMGHAPSRADEAANQYISKAIDDLEELADPAGQLPNGKLLTVQIQEYDEAFQKARAMAYALWKRFPLDTDKWEVVAVERLVELNLKVPRIAAPIRTRVDLLLKNRETGEGWIVDHKTTSLSPTARAASMRFGNQTRLYRLGAIHAFPDIPIVGIRHNIIQKPKIKYCPNTKDKEGFHAYIERVGKWYDTEAEKRPNDPPFLLSEVRFHEPPMTQEFFLKLRAGARACRCKPSLDIFHRNDRACIGSYGRVCHFLPLCSSNSGIWEELIPNLFTQVDRDKEDEKEKP